MSDVERDQLIGRMGNDIGRYALAIKQKQIPAAHQALTRLTGGLGLLAMELDDLDDPSERN